MATAEELDADIPTEAVRTRPGGGGISLSYVDGYYVISELNRIFGTESWSFQCVHGAWVCPPKQVDGKWFAAYEYRGRLSIGTMHKEGSAVGFSKGDSYGVVAHNAMAEAETDALKRAARLLGQRLGLALYDSQQRHVSSENGAPSSPRAKPVAQSSKVPGPTNKEDWTPETVRFSKHIGKNIRDLYREKPRAAHWYVNAVAEDVENASGDPRKEQYREQNEAHLAALKAALAEVQGQSSFGDDFGDDDIPF